jgi:hypothetical protein
MGMRKFLMPIAAALLAAAITTSIAMAGHSHRGGDQRFRHERAAYAIGLWGDLPYSTTQATTGVPDLIADMNRQNLAFTAHDGDLKSGSSECTNAVYTQALSYFNSLRAPAAFTPGDNDWVDCDRTPGYNDRVQLDKERQLFFSTPYTLGQHRLRQEVQQTPLCLGASGPAACVENRRWTVGGVTYATLNVQGTCNNLCDSATGLGGRPGRIRGAEQGQHCVAAGNVPGGADPALRGSHVDHPGRSRMGHLGRDAGAHAGPKDARRERRAGVDGRVP